MKLLYQYSRSDGGGGGGGGDRVVYNINIKEAGSRGIFGEIEMYIMTLDFPTYEST